MLDLAPSFSTVKVSPSWTEITRYGPIGDPGGEGVVGRLPLMGVGSKMHDVSRDRIERESRNFISGRRDRFVFSKRSRELDVLRLPPRR